MKTHAEAVQTLEAATNFISNVHVDSQYEKVIKIIEQQINMIGKNISEENKNKLTRSIKSSSQLKMLLANNNSNDE